MSFWDALQAWTVPPGVSLRQRHLVKRSRTPMFMWYFLWGAEATHTRTIGGAFGGVLGAVVVLVVVVVVGGAPGGGLGGGASM